MGACVTGTECVNDRGAAVLTAGTDEGLSPLVGGSLARASSAAAHRRGLLPQTPPPPATVCTRHPPLRTGAARTL